MESKISKDNPGKSINISICDFSHLGYIMNSLFYTRKGE